MEDIKMSHTTTTTNGVASSSMDDTLDRMIDSSFGVTTSVVAAASEEHRPEFIPSKTWQGSKPGYYFGRSAQHGLGYHLDHVASEGKPQDGATNKRKRKQVRISEEKNKVRVLAGDELLKEAEEASQNTRVLELSKRGIHQATLALERAQNRNALERAQHVDAPENYMESELALHEQITAFKAVAANPELYSQLVGTVEHFAGLLTHDNSDVALSVINVFVEWLDPEVIEASTEDSQLIPSLVVQHCLDMVVSNLGRLGTEDEEDIAGIEDIFTLIEYLLEFDMSLGGIVNEADNPLLVSKILNETTFLSWLLPQATDSSSKVQGRAAEVLALLLQQEGASDHVADIGQLPPYQSAFHEEKADSKAIDGMELLLQAIAVYRKRQPPTEAELEILENLCISLSLLLFQPHNVRRFLDAQGIELVLRCLKEKVHAGRAALKTLEFSGADPVYVEACERLVEVDGLKHIFPILMGRSIPKPAPCSDAGRSAKSKRTQHARRQWLEGLEESAIRIIYSLTRNIKDTSPVDAKERLLVKFLEADCEKCDRLVELCLKYDEKARAAVYSFYRSDVEEEMDVEEVELAALNAKLNGGGAVFQQVGAIAAFACVGSKRCHEHILAQLTLQKSGIGVIKAALEEFASLIGDGDQKEQLEQYLLQI